jgi:RNA polymerase sigma-70 factor, ECF subfamily
VLRVDDIEIIRSFQGGNLGAFDEVVAEFREPLMRHALRRLHDAGAAEDAVQETFVRAYRSFHRLHEASRIGPWLHHILANVCIDEANRRQRDADKNQRAIADPLLRRSSPGVEQQLGLDADMSPLGAAMGALPENYQEALLLRFVDELSYEEMAVAVDTTEQNVRARVSRARSAMKIALRGVAVLPAMLAGVMLRRGPRSTALAERAVERADTTQRLASTAESGVLVSKFATQMAPAVEAVNTLALSAHSSAPALSKAAIGIGAIALAAVSANPERSTVIPPSPAPIVMQVEDQVSTPESDRTSQGDASTNQESGLGITGFVSQTENSTDQQSDSDAQSQGSAATDTGAATSTPSSGNGSGSGSSGSSDSTDSSADSGGQVLAPAPLVLTGGTVTALSVTVTEVGPRIDMVGQLRLEVDGVTTVTAFTGRWSIDAEPDRTGDRRFSGVITVTVGTTLVEIRLAGHVREPGTEDANDSDTRSISGLFRTANGEAAGLVEAGSFSGSFGPGTLVLRLTT